MSYGVFRPRPDIPWRLRHRRPAPLSESPTRAQSGAAPLVLGGSAQPVKVAAVGGVCGLVVSGSGRAGRRAPTVGVASVALAGSGADRKVAAPAGSGALALTGAALHARLSQQSGVAGFVLGGQARVTSGQPAVLLLSSHTAGGLGRNVTSTGTAAMLLAGTAQPRKIVTVGGVCGLALSGAAAAGKRTPAQGVGPLAVTGTVWFAARVGGRCGLTLTAIGRAAKVAGGRGTAAFTLGGAGAASRRAPTGGRSAACLTPFGTALRRAPTRGGVGVTLTGRSFPVVPGPTLGTRVSPALVVPAGPIAGSRIWWAATLDGGGLLVETSVDAGATWQTATNGAAVPRLVQGDVRSARTVLTRVTLSRATPESPSPRLHRMEVEVAVDSSQDELCPLGVFTLNDVEIDDGPRGLSIELAGADLSRKVSRNRWDDTYVIAEGTNYGTAIMDGVRNRMPDAVFNFASTNRTTPRLFFGEQSSNDPWQDFQDMATAIGHELFFDARGICTLRPEPDPEIGDSVWEFEDTANPTMIELARRVTDENTYNKVVVTGEGSSNTVPVRAVAIDDDPASPTYWLGPYGTVTLRVTNPLVTTVEQAQDAADALLRRVKGATEAVELLVVPMPALEPGDVVTVTRGKSKVEGRFLIDQLRIPLGADEAMRAVGRRQRQ